MPDPGSQSAIDPAGRPHVGTLTLIHTLAKAGPATMLSRTLSWAANADARTPCTWFGLNSWPVHRLWARLSMVVDLFGC